jgi:hypothetical protein
MGSVENTAYVRLTDLRVTKRFVSLISKVILSASKFNENKSEVQVFPPTPSSSPKASTSEDSAP